MNLNPEAANLARTLTIGSLTDAELAEMEKRGRGAGCDEAADLILTELALRQMNEEN